jgi:menaquinone-dependent protoporphyrinogen oxidase
MPTKVLVTYTTNSGSTREVAEAVAGGLGTNSLVTDVRRMEDVPNLELYSAVVVGGPMILGWHRRAVDFLKKQQKVLSQVPVAYFFTAMSLMRTRETHIQGVPIYIDPGLGKCPEKPDRRSFRERYATVEHYLGPVLKQTPVIRPVSAAFFAGKMDYSRLNLPQMLFARFIVGAQPGDRRNWDAIREWAAGLHALFT